MFLRRKEKSIKESCQSIRESFAYFGHDLSEFTDEEIIEGVIAFGKVVSSFGVTTEEAVGALQMIGRIMNRNSRNKH